MKEPIEEVVQGTCKWQTMLINVFPTMLMMKHCEFEECLAKELGLSSETVKKYFSRGFSAGGRIQNKELERAIRHIYQQRIMCENISEKDKADIREAYNTLADVLFEAIHSIEEPRQKLKKCPHATISARLRAFMVGKWPESGNGLTSEDVALLREGLKLHPPQGIEL